MKNIRHILGCMSLGGAFNKVQSHQLIKDWVKLGYNELDTAIVYQGGASEKIMGKLDVCRDPEKVKIACKANPVEGFKCEDVVNQLNTSLKRLCVPSADIFYLHWPHSGTPIEKTLEGVNQLHQDGKFKEFGLSNFASWEVAFVYHTCQKYGYVLPTVYQGMYNALTRDIELKLIPALRLFGIRFYAYNPLAGGMLTGKYDFNKANKDQPMGRFFDSNANYSRFESRLTEQYKDRYWHYNYKTGIQRVTEVLGEIYDNKVSLMEASMRWLNHHSVLMNDDGIIFGISKEEHLQQNIDAALVAEPLHGDVVLAFNEAWSVIKPDCPKYYRK